MKLCTVPFGQRRICGIAQERVMEAVGIIAGRGFAGSVNEA